jgi:transposase
MRAEIVALQAHYGSREIARRVSLSRKVVRRVLEEEGVTSPTRAKSQSKLDRFREQIELRVQKQLTTTRILRELREQCYTGGRSILSRHVRSLRAQLRIGPRPQIKRRFETAPGQEMQIDWSPYTVPIGGRPTAVHALGCLLCASRKLYLRFYRDERQATLLEGLASAFEYFDGVAFRVVLDNMATAVLGRIGPNRKPLWHPRFLELTQHYGFEPFACQVRDPDRKGKKEKSFRLIFDDFIKGTDFASWDELDERRRIWLDHTPEVGNLRRHGTTGLVPNEAFRAEHELLIRLPQERFAVGEQSVRLVDQDATLSIRGTRYTVPAALATRAVAVRLYAEHFEVLDPHGRIAFSRRYVADADKGKLVIDQTHYANLPRRPRGDGRSGERLDEAFVRRFPDLAPLCDGLKLRFKTLAPIHLRALLRLCDRYGQEALREAATRAQEYRRFDALAIERILERTHPLGPEAGDTAPPLGGTGPIVLGEVEPGSLDGWQHLDAAPASPLADPAADPAAAPPPPAAYEDDDGP